MPPAAVAKWEALGKAMMTAPGYTGLMEKLVSTGSYLDSKAFSQTIVSTYREMGKLIPTLGLKQN